MSIVKTILERELAKFRFGLIRIENDLSIEKKEDERKLIKHRLKLQKRNIKEIETVLKTL